MSVDRQSRASLDLSKAVILILDPTPMGMEITSQILNGFGARRFHRCLTVEAAKQTVMEAEMDLLVVDSIAQTGEGYDFVRWLRQEAGEPNAFAPVLLTTAYTRPADVSRARDCGAHFMVAKPISPTILLERIFWVSKEGRAFLHADTYVGPDRRFQEEPPPGGVGRRREDIMRPGAVKATAAA